MHAHREHLHFMAYRIGDAEAALPACSRQGRTWLYLRKGVQSLHWQTLSPQTANCLHQMDLGPLPGPHTADPFSFTFVLKTNITACAQTQPGSPRLRCRSVHLYLNRAIITQIPVIFVQASANQEIATQLRSNNACNSRFSNRSAIQLAFLQLQSTKRI